MAFTFTRNELLNDIILIVPQVFGDDRGFFMETYNKQEFKLYGINFKSVLNGHSKSQKGVFRGLHFQTKHTQAKIVRVIHGSILDFALDIRKKSPTYGKYIIELLSENNKKQLFIPKGFAHGFLSLEDNTQLLYQCDDYYDPVSEAGILYTDTDVNIDWHGIMDTHNIKELLLAEKDKNHPTLKEFYATNPF